MAFKKATKNNLFVKLCLSGPSGSGKTFSALLIAKGLGGSTAVLDTEHKSASLYADRFEFDTWDDEDPNGYPPEFFCEVIKSAEQAGYQNLIIDSLSHEWFGRGGCLELAEMIGRSRYKGNTFAAWGDVTPRHNRMIETILGAKLNIIATMRSKTDYVIQKDEKTGKATPQKVGLAAVQRDGMDYEFTVVFELERDNHIAVAGKDRTHLFSDPVLITEATGQRIAQWLTKPQPVTATVSMGMFVNNLQSAPPSSELPKPESKKVTPFEFINAEASKMMAEGKSPDEVWDFFRSLVDFAIVVPEDMSETEMRTLATNLWNLKKCGNNVVQNEH